MGGPLGTLDMGINSDHPLFPAVERAEGVIEQLVGRAAGRVRVAWEGGYDRDGQPVARVRLSDSGVTRSDEFRAADLSNEYRVRGRLFQLWDGVLAERFDRQWEVVQKSLSENGEG